MDTHLRSLSSLIIISNSQPNSSEVYDFKLAICCCNKNIHFTCLAYCDIKIDKRHCFLNCNSTRYIINDIIGKKDKRNMSNLNPATHPKDAAQVLQSCLHLCNPMHDSPAGSSIIGILQTRILEWVTISFSRGPSLPRYRTLSLFSLLH